jgi:hypothetical protein
MRRTPSWHLSAADVVVAVCPGHGLRPVRNADRRREHPFATECASVGISGSMLFAPRGQAVILIPSGMLLRSRKWRTRSSGAAKYLRGAVVGLWTNPMQLHYTRIIVESMKGSLETWPNIWPTGPAIVQGAHRRFASAIGIAPGPRTISRSQLHGVLDEWLMSSDRRRISVRQRAICACALLELFASSPNVTREAPDIVSALQNIAPAVPLMTTTAIRAICHVLTTMHRAAKMLNLSEDEQATVLLAAGVSQLLVGKNRLSVMDIESCLSAITSAATGHDMRRLRHLAFIASQWRELPPALRRRFKTTCAPS